MVEAQELWHNVFGCGFVYERRQNGKKEKEHRACIGNREFG